ncbi:RagB/SusD family nutrient uptake outer membrane protein [Chitinophaga costaii]|nr:RagB/SusD family nutrient uptake outer membrane protein [Chitinophaga costaii]
MKIASTLLMAGSLMLAACNKYLEVQPDNRTKLDSPEKVAQLLTSAYPANDYICFAESMSDNVGDREHAGDQYSGDLRVNINAYHFIDYASTEKGSPDVYWQGCYEAIAAANQALQACEAAGDNPAYAPYKGEALLARAYAHFMLVTFFAKTYDSTTAGADPGIPYVLVPETTLYAKYERKTVKYVYDMIEKDLLEGLPLISNAAFKIPAYHFNKAAANAFAARFYLFKKDYNKVIQYASQVFPGGNPADRLRDINGTFQQLTRAERLENYTSASESANLLLATTNSIWARAWIGYQFGLNRERTISIYYSGNVTGAVMDYPIYYYGANVNNDGFEKFRENFIYTSAEIGYAYIYVPLLTTEEVLFNRAEANALTGHTDAAIADLNAFLSKRISGYDASVNNLTLQKMMDFYGLDAQKALVQTILDLKQMEFIQEGMRWLDILRYNLPVTHEEVGGETTTILGNDPRKILQIPESAQSAGIAPNPR